MDKVEKKIISISYSGMNMWRECSYLYYIQYVLGKPRPPGTVETFFGTLAHKYVQDILSKKIDRVSAVDRFIKTWDRACRLYRKKIDLEKFDTEDLKQSGINILNCIEEKFEKEFGKYKVVEIERRLKSPIEGHDKIFKGFIDIVIQLENGSYVILDFKTTKSMFFFKKYQDKYKDYQLTLYKHFYVLEDNLDPKKVETYFCLLEKNSKSKAKVIFSRVTSGPVKVKNALELLEKCLRNIDEGRWLRKKNFCYKFNKTCEYKFTEFCP